LTSKLVAQAMRQHLQSAVRLHVRVTPYQIDNDLQPWKKRDEKKFNQMLREAGFEIDRKVMFADKPASLEAHFAVLDDFR
jgi:hypothetical protein